MLCFLFDNSCGNSFGIIEIERMRKKEIERKRERESKKERKNS